MDSATPPLGMNSRLRMGPSAPHHFPVAPESINLRMVPVISVSCARVRFRDHAQCWSDRSHHWPTVRLTIIHYTTYWPACPFVTLLKFPFWIWFIFSSPTHQPIHPPFHQSTHPTHRICILFSCYFSSVPPIHSSTYPPIHAPRATHHAANMTELHADADADATSPARARRACHRLSRMARPLAGFMRRHRRNHSTLVADKLSYSLRARTPASAGVSSLSAFHDLSDPACHHALSAALRALAQNRAHPSSSSSSSPRHAPCDADADGKLHPFSREQMEAEQDALEIAAATPPHPLKLPQPPYPSQLPYPPHPPHPPHRHTETETGTEMETESKAEIKVEAEADAMRHNAKGFSFSTRARRGRSLRAKAAEPPSRIRSSLRACLLPAAADCTSSVTADDTPLTLNTLTTHGYSGDGNDAVSGGGGGGGGAKRGWARGRAQSTLPCDDVAALVRRLSHLEMAEMEVTALRHRVSDLEWALDAVRGDADRVRDDALAVLAERDRMVC